MVSQAQIRATQKYNKKAYDRIQIRVKKGEAEKIKAYAEKKGMSLNGYINKLMVEDMSK